MLKHAADGARHAAVGGAAANDSFAHVHAHLGCLELDRSAGSDALEVDYSCSLQSPCLHFCWLHTQQHKGQRQRIERYMPQKLKTGD